MATRFLFDPPRRPKPKAGPTLKSLLVRCPSTSKLTDTGRTIEEERWEDADRYAALTASALNAYADRLDEGVKLMSSTSVAGN